MKYFTVVTADNLTYDLKPTKLFKDKKKADEELKKLYEETLENVADDVDNESTYITEGSMFKVMLFGDDLYYGNVVEFEVMEDDNYDKKLMLCTIKELAMLCTELLNAEHKLCTEFPVFDFAIVDSAEDEDLETVRLNARGWYGLKKVNTHFDSKDDLLLVSDYYGGGCANTLFVVEGEQNDTVAKAIEKMITNTLDVCEVIDSETKLIVEMYEGGVLC